MDSDIAFAIIKRALTARPGITLRDERFEDEFFGSFSINFTIGETAFSVVNDRGQIVLTRGLDGSGPWQSITDRLSGLGPDDLHAFLSTALNQLDQA